MIKFERIDYDLVDQVCNNLVSIYKDDYLVNFTQEEKFRFPVSPGVESNSVTVYTVTIDTAGSDLDINITDESRKATVEFVRVLGTLNINIRITDEDNRILKRFKATVQKSYSPELADEVLESIVKILDETLTRGTSAP